MVQRRWWPCGWTASATTRAVCADGCGIRTPLCFLLLRQWRHTPLLHSTPLPAPFSGFNPDDFDGMQSRSPSMSSMASRGSRSTQSSKPPPRKMSLSTHNETYDLPQDSLAESLAASNAVVGYSYDGERWFHGTARAQPHSACHLFSPLSVF